MISEKKIFMINNSDFHHSLEDILKKRYQVFSFHCAGEILEHVQDRCELPDLIITPLVIPIGSINGGTLTSILKENVPSVPILLITNLTSLREEIPADDFITPFEDFNFPNTDNFLQKVEHLLSPCSLATACAN